MNDKDFEALEEGYFWLQSCGSQNDPEEGLMELTYEVLKHSDIKELKTLCNCQNFGIVMSKVSEFNLGMKAKLAEFRDKHCMICFSEDSSSEDMWKEYADQEQGACLAYSKKGFVAKKVHLIPVLYKKKKCVSDYLKIVDNELVVPDAQLAKAFITKTTEWDYEREWRHIEKCHSGRKDIDIYPEKIYVGKHMPPANNKRLADFCTLKGIALLQR